MEIDSEDKIIYNNGICGDTTITLQKHLFKRAIKYKPSKLFLSIGSNDIGFDKRDVKEIYDNITTVIEEVQRRSKDTKIYVLSVLPVNPARKDFINRDYVDERSNFDINMLNYYLRNYTSRNRISFINLNHHLCNNFEQLNLQYTSDGFHLNEEGYKILSELIMKYV
jgi:lysophospholipase L1-like esterase